MTKLTLKMARAKVNMSQEDVAGALNVSRNTYNGYEQYKVPMDIPTGIRFCKLVDVPFDDIIFFKP